MDMYLVGFLVPGGLAPGACAGHVGCFSWPLPGLAFGARCPTDGSLPSRRFRVRSSWSPPATWLRCFEEPVVAPAALGLRPSTRARLAAARRCRLSPSLCLRMVVSFGSASLGASRAGRPGVLSCLPPSL